HPPDHAGRKVLLDAVGRSRRQRAQEPRLELLAMGAIVDPFACGRDPLTGGNGRGMADNCYDITMPTRLGSKNAEAVLSVVIGDALDEAGQHSLRGWFRLRLHVDYRIIGFTAVRAWSTILGRPGLGTGAPGASQVLIR